MSVQVWWADLNVHARARGALFRGYWAPVGRPRRGPRSAVRAEAPGRPPAQSAPVGRPAHWPPVGRPRRGPRSAAPRSPPTHAPTPHLAQISPNDALKASPPAFTITKVRSASERRELLKAVYEEARECVRCPLHQTRTTVVFGAGNADADLMFVGEAPGANEDRLGLPFVGQAGKLLDKLLIEIGLERSDVFIANVLKCRPPQNRDPHPNEIESCQDYLRSSGGPDRAGRDLHPGELLDEAPAPRQHRDLAASWTRRGAGDRPACRPPVSAVSPRRGPLHALDPRGVAGRLPAHPRAAWPWGLPSSRTPSQS